jgi:hypothetical protein
VQPFRAFLPRGVLRARFPTKILYIFLISSMRFTCPTHIILLHFIVLLIYGKKYNICRLFNDAFSVTRLCSVDDRVTSEWWWTNIHTVRGIRTHGHFVKAIKAYASHRVTTGTGSKKYRLHWSSFFMHFSPPFCCFILFRSTLSLTQCSEIHSSVFT